MKIAFVVNNYPPRLGGVELHVHSLATELIRLGHEVTVVALSDSPSRSNEQGIDVIRLPERFRIGDVLGFPPLGTMRKLSRLLHSRGIEVVSIHTRFFPMSYVGLRSAMRSKIPVVHTEHGSDHVSSNSLLIRVCSKFVDVTVGKWVLRHADTVLGVSEAVVSFVQRLSGVAASVFYNAILDSPSIAPLAHDQTKYVFVGRLVPGKGWDTFLHLVAELYRTDPSVSAHLIGEGPDKAAASQLIHELALSEVAILHGRQSPLEVREHLRGSTLVNPTLLSEGFQTTLIEAIAEGGRVLTYPVPGAAKLRDSGAPVYITAEKSLKSLETSSMGISGRNWVPATRAQIEPWLWPNRAKDFVEVCAQARNSIRG